MRDTAAEPLSPARSVGLGGVGVRIAGRYVAWLDGPYRDVPGSVYDIVVYDRMTDGELYRVSRNELDGSPISLDVQEDGKVALRLAGRQGTPAGKVFFRPNPVRVRLSPAAGGCSDSAVRSASGPASGCSTLLRGYKPAAGRSDSARPSDEGDGMNRGQHAGVLLRTDAHAASAAAFASNSSGAVVT